MKLQVLITYILLSIGNMESYSNFSIIEKIYYKLFLTLLLIFLKNKKIIIGIHLIYILLIITHSLVCNHKMLLLTGLIAIILLYFSSYINRACYFFDLQLPKQMHHKGLYFFKSNMLSLLGNFLFIYNIIMSIYKINGGVISNNLNRINMIMIVIVIGTFCNDYYQIIQKKPKKNKCLIFAPLVLDNL